MCPLSGNQPPAVYPGIPEILDTIENTPGAYAAVATLKHQSMAEKSLEQFDLENPKP